MHVCDRRLWVENLFAVRLQKSFAMCTWTFPLYPQSFSFPSRHLLVVSSSFEISISSWMLGCSYRILFLLPWLARYYSFYNFLEKIIRSISPVLINGILYSKFGMTCRYFHRILATFSIPISIFMYLSTHNSLSLSVYKSSQ